jgi:hypothetical protein
MNKVIIENYMENDTIQSIVFAHGEISIRSYEVKKIISRDEREPTRDEIERILSACKASVDKLKK